MKELAISTTTYEVLGDFRVDIVHNRADEDSNWEAYLYHKNYGVKDLMFGVSDKDESFTGFLELVLGNLGKYVSYYYEDHMVEDEMLSVGKENEQ